MNKTVKRGKKNIKSPMRKCVGCMESKPKSELIRIVFYDNKVSIDYSGKANGRGVYLCQNPECIESAKNKKAFQRSFKTRLDDEVIENIFQELMNVKQ